MLWANYHQVVIAASGQPGDKRVAGVAGGQVCTNAGTVQGCFPWAYSPSTKVREQIIKDFKMHKGRHSSAVRLSKAQG